MTEQRDARQSNFSRFTVLYTQRMNILGGVYGNVLKGWAIPADVTPVYVGTDFGMFSHYDPEDPSGDCEVSCQEIAKTLRAADAAEGYRMAIRRKLSVIVDDIR